MAEASRLVFVYVRGIDGVVVFGLLDRGVVGEPLLEQPKTPGRFTASVGDDMEASCLAQADVNVTKPTKIDNYDRDVITIRNFVGHSCVGPP